MTAVAKAGRVAQRRRTRKAIVDATTVLLAQGIDPSVNDIAAAADVSRRTVYLYFPTLDQLILDATVGAMSTDIDAVLAASDPVDAKARITALINALGADMSESLPLGRRLIKLTVDAPAPGTGGPKRGYRRIGWIETAIEPLRERLSPRQFDDLLSSLAIVVGWEAFIVLSDVRGLSQQAARELCTNCAVTLIDAALAATPANAGQRPRRRATGGSARPAATA